MNWLHYLLEANLYLGVFYLAYYLFLSNQTWYSLNRTYLLATSVISFIIPFIQLNILKPVEKPQLISVVLIPPPQVPAKHVVDIISATPEFTWQDGLIYLYLAGAAILLIVFLVKIFQLFRMAKTDRKDESQGYKLVYLDGANTAFSFFNFLFIGTDIQKADTIIKHELVHINQKHSADIVFIELLKIVNWFNPFVYLLQYSLKAIHEYIADEQTALTESDALAYSSFLVENAYGLGGSSVTHSFFNYNLLKKRIIMLNQKRSGKLARLKYLLAVPVCVGILCASTLAFSKDYGFINVGPHRIDKNNKSPQVPDPVNRLLVTQHGVSIITDKFSHKNANGSVRYFTAMNISNKNIVDLQKEGITINVISDGNAIKANTDTPKYVHFTSNDNIHNITTAYTTTKGYDVVEDINTHNNITSMKVVITNKDGSKHAYYNNKISATERKMLADKYGFTFISEKLTEVKLLPPPSTPGKPTNREIPPPPPVPAGSVISKRIPPQPPTPAAPVKTTSLLSPLQAFPDFVKKSEKSC